MSAEPKASDRRLILGVAGAFAWGLVPLLLYLPEPTPVWIESLVIFGCFPGTVLAYVAVGGVHGHMADFPWLCSVFTTGLALAALFLLRALARRRRALSAPSDSRRM